VTRDGGLVALNVRLQVADADLVAADPREQPEPGGVGEPQAGQHDARLRSGVLDSGHAS